MRGHISVNHELHAPAYLAPRTDSHYPLKNKAGWVPQLVWTRGKRDRYLPLPRIELRNPARRFFFTILNELPWLATKQKRNIKVIPKLRVRLFLGYGAILIPVRLKVTKTSDCRIFCERYELGRIWKENCVALFRYIPEFTCRKCESQRASSFKNSPCSVQIRTTEI